MTPKKSCNKNIGPTVSQCCNIPFNLPFNDLMSNSYSVVATRGGDLGGTGGDGPPQNLEWMDGSGFIPLIISQIATSLHCDPCKDLFNCTSSKSSNSLSLTQVRLLFIISYEQVNSRLDIPSAAAHA